MLQIYADSGISRGALKGNTPAHLGEMRIRALEMVQGARSRDPSGIKAGRSSQVLPQPAHGLRTFLDDSRLCLDNNLSERNLRAVVVGRKNWLFAGSDEGARRAAIFYSIIASCRLQGFDPETYLVKFMRTMAMNPICKAEDLMPGKI